MGGLLHRKSDDGGGWALNFCFPLFVGGTLTSAQRQPNASFLKMRNRGNEERLIFKKLSGANTEKRKKSPIGDIK